MLNRGGGKFVEVGTPVGLGGIGDGRGVAFADFDRDGDVDILVNNYKAYASYYRNDFGEGNAWLAVRLRGTKANRGGVGAQILADVANTDLGQRSTMMRLVGSYGYSGQSSLEQIFGLGTADKVEDLRVRWPDGSVENFGAHPARSRVILTQGTGSLESAAPAPAPVAVSTRPAPGWLVALLLVGVGLGSAAIPLLRRRRASSHAVRDP
jgi:hypothetical protein